MTDMENAEEAAARLAEVSAASGISYFDLVESIIKLADVMRRFHNPESQIEMIRLDPNLSRFQKWLAIRKIKRKAAWG